MKSSSKSIWFQNLLMLMKVNRIIVSRASKARKLTPILFVLGFVIMFTVSAHLVGTIEESSLSEDIRLIGIAMYMVILFEIMFSVGRYSIGNAVHIGFLFRFPLSLRFLMTYLTVENIISTKSLIYLGFAIAVTYRVFTVSFLAGMAAMLLFILYFLLLEVWINILILLLGKTFRTHKFIYPLLLFALLMPIYLSQFGIIDSVKFAEFCTSGILGVVGRGISFALDAQWSQAGTIAIQIMALTIAGMIVGVAILRKKEYSAY